MAVLPTQTVTSLLMSLWQPAASALRKPCVSLKLYPSCCFPFSATLVDLLVCSRPLTLPKHKESSHWQWWV